MGYLNNETVIIDAVLTNKGKELLSKGSNNFKITKFAVADDEVNYDLYNPNHTLGSNYYGEVIENLPILEANPNETQVLKYKLVTLPKDTTRIPIISVGQNDIVLNAAGQSAIINPQTINYTNGNAQYGYTAILSDSTVADIYPAANSSINIDYVPEFTQNLSKQSVSVIGYKFEIIAKRQVNEDATATITLIGNETGGRTIVNLTVKKETTATASRTSV
jgi:hypothetical protein